MQLVKDTHEHTGHFGEKRTMSLLCNGYWWRGMLDDVRAVVGSCAACDLSRAQFNAQLPMLQPLPVMGLHYRWSVDLCGPFPTSMAGNRYVMVMVEHYSKFVELAALPAKEARHTAAAFTSRVLGRYGAMAEVLTDQGSEWLAEFHQVLERALVDHRMTSAGRPSSNGASERVVQVVKQALRCRCHDTKVGDQWDDDLPWVMLGINCSAQASTGLTPYALMHAQPPTVPPAVKERLAEPLSVDDAGNDEVVAKQFLQRARLLQQHCVMAGQNLHIAQHRDTLRYATVRSGLFKPRERRFDVGDFVYERKPGAEALHMRARPAIYRIKRITPAGVAVLQGRCGRTIDVHLAHLAPCHLANIDPTVDVTLQQPGVDTACEVCRHAHDAADMLLCDECNTGWHTYCLVPEVMGVPEGVWLCPRCEAVGVSVEAVQQRLEAQRYLLPEGEEMPAAPVAAAVELQLPPPEPWDLGQPEQFRAVLQHLMPGSWEARWTTRVASAVAAVAAAAVRGQPLPIVCTTDAEVEFLLSWVLLQQCQLVLEPFAGAGTVTRVLRAAGSHVCLPMTCLSCILLMLSWMLASLHHMLRWCV
jgi:hypothetical protein